MGVRHAREYSDILKELTASIANITDSYHFFEMEENEWKALSAEEQLEVMEALADDVFYGLGENKEIDVGSGKVVYRKEQHVIDVYIGDDVHQIISLI